MRVKIAEVLRQTVPRPQLNDDDITKTKTENIVEYPGAIDGVAVVVGVGVGVTSAILYCDSVLHVAVVYATICSKQSAK